jgi:hypothetical protein
MLRLLRRLFRPNPAASQLPPEDQGDDVLEFIGAPAIVFSWARRERQALEGLWASCPRADWLLAIAGCAGVPLERLTRIARELYVTTESSWSTADDLVATVATRLDALYEEDPALADVREKHSAGAPPAMIQDPLERQYAAQTDVDDAHEAFHRRHADRVRDALPYRELRAALYGSDSASPYR